MNNNEYLIVKKKNHNEAFNLDCNLLKGYDITPKNRMKKKDTIEVNKMLLIMPSMIDTLIKKKIDKKIKMLLYHIINMEDEDDDNHGTGLLLNEAERLRVKLLNEYYAYIDKEYEKEMLDKIELIERELKIRLAIYEEVKEEKIGKIR